MFNGGLRLDDTRARRRTAARRRLSALVGLTVLFGSGMAGSALSAPAGPADRASQAGPAAQAADAAQEGPAATAGPAAPATTSRGPVAEPAGPGAGTGAAPGDGAAAGRPADPGSESDAGKVTLCHSTGSETNPFVEITISENGLNGHDGHDGDLVPAPAGGCPRPEPDRARVTLCHATRSATNPYVVITIDENGLHGHDGHDGDIIPAPAGGCPVAAATPPATAATTTTTTTTPTVPTTVPPARTVASMGGATEVRTLVLGEVLGAPIQFGMATFASGSPSEAVANPAPAEVPTRVLGATLERSAGTLPRTGGAVTTLLACALGLLVLGAALRLGARPAGRPGRSAH